jgi:hypothetical protein
MAQTSQVQSVAYLKESWYKLSLGPQLSVGLMKISVIFIRNGTRPTLR